jgi:aspartate/methionine/tyrosine aminotransferase
MTENPVLFPPFRLERYFARHEFTAPRLLCVSDCETLTAGALLDFEPGARQAFENLALGYTDSHGAPGLREEIAGLYQGIGPGNALVHVGAQEAIFTFAAACLKPGDEAIIHVPCYQSLEEVARGLGCSVVPWTARMENGFVPDPDELARLVTARTRAIVVNSPHNPTGACLDASGTARVAEIAANAGCLLFSDEVYRFMEHGPGEAPRPACELYERAVSLGVMSKSFGLAGLRVGWAACRDETALAAMAAAKDYTTICGSAPSEFLAALALRHKDAVLGRTRSITLGNLILLDEFMARHAARFAWVRPTGGPIAFPRLAGGDDAGAFCRDVLDGCGVLLLPGGLYGDEWASHFRIGFGRSDFARGLGVLDQYLSERG